MDSKTGRELAVPLQFNALPECPDGLEPLPCLRCGALLDVHQPDADLPDRMLATCDTCKSWHLIDCSAGAGPFVVVLLPDTAPFRAALGG